MSKMLNRSRVMFGIVGILYIVFAVSVIVCVAIDSIHLEKRIGDLENRLKQLESGHGE